MELENKIALVTGAARGIGFAHAKELLRSGVKHVTIVDLETSDGGESAEKLNAEFGKGRAIFVACDVTKVSELEAAFAKTIKEFGGLDILINNAGIANESRWELTVDVNLNAVIRSTYLGLEYMGKHKGGKGGVIVNTSSIFGLDPTPWSPVYVATKHAVVGLSRSFGTPYYYEKTGVRVLTLCPGVTDTQLLVDFAPLLPDLIDINPVMADLATYSRQKPDDVVQSIAPIIKSAKNGSVWVAEGEESAYEVYMPDRFALKDLKKASKE